MRMLRSVLTLGVVTSVLLALPIAGSAVVINEIRIDMPGTDTDEYFELAGAPGESLDDLTYIVIGDGAGASGVIEAVISLTGNTLDGSGLFCAAEASASFTPSLTTTVNFENSDNVTHMLVSGFTGALGDDLDTDDNGTLDTTPWTAVVDCVALIETVGTGDQVYCSTQVGPDGFFVPGHVFLCGTTWFIGGFSFPTDDSPCAENDCTVSVDEQSWSGVKEQFRE
ncbi:MAG: hypothetical protein ACE5G2_06030 [Candidatus Krumholzibacteriia bacterium]